MNQGQRRIYPLAKANPTWTAKDWGIAPSIEGDFHPLGGQQAIKNCGQDEADNCSQLRH